MFDFEIHVCSGARVNYSCFLVPYGENTVVQSSAFVRALAILGFARTL